MNEMQNIGKCLEVLILKGLMISSFRGAKSGWWGGRRFTLGKERRGDVREVFEILSADIHKHSANSLFCLEAPMGIIWMTPCETGDGQGRPAR